MFVNTLLYNTILYKVYNMIHVLTIWHCIIWYDIVSGYDIVSLYCIMWYDIVSYDMISYPILWAEKVS